METPAFFFPQSLSVVYYLVLLGILFMLVLDHLRESFAILLKNTKIKSILAMQALLTCIAKIDLIFTISDF